jgi:hypothetical protein
VRVTQANSKMQIHVADGKNSEFLANTRQVPKQFQIHPSSLIIVKLALNTPAIDQSKKYFYIRYN